MRILFVINSLRLGGAERVASHLSNYWAECGHHVDLVTFDTAENDFYKTSPAVHRLSCGVYHTLGKGIFKKILLNAKRIIGLHRLIQSESPDVIVSFMDVPNMMVLISGFFHKIPIVISERKYPPFYHHGWVFDFLRNRLYRHSTKFVAQTQKTAEWTLNFICEKSVTVIPNPLEKISKSVEVFDREKSILAVGRLSHEKGFDLLISACEQVFQKHPDWSLKIAGEGRERSALQRQIEGLHLTRHITLVGAIEDLSPLYQGASLFVLTSRSEGFPNALLEAMGHGLPLISFDCLCGPSEMIESGYNGMLIQPDNMQKLSEAICCLIEDPALREKFSQASLEASQKYDIHAIGDQWLSLFREVIYCDKS